jgi:uncharacterized membrane protein
VTVPADATAGTQHITVKGTTSSGSSASLGVDVRVSPNAAGEVKLTTGTPQLKGASDASFSFTLTLANDTPQDLPFSATATGPDGWTITAEIGSQAQAASVVVTAGSTSTIAVDVTSGNQKAHVDLSVTITGSYNLALSTVNQQLNMNATAGSASDITLSLTNSGTADVTGAAMSDSAPTGWKVTFDTPTVDVPAGGQAVQVVAHVTPSSDAIAGDYITTFKATAPVANASADIRVTVQTSALWGAIGIGLIALVLIGLWSIFRRYGRR